MVICLFYFAKSVFYVIKRSYVMANIVGRVLKYICNLLSIG